MNKLADKIKRLYEGKISIKARIALWYTGLIVVIVSTFLGTMFYISSYIVRDSVHERLKKAVESTFEQVEFLEEGIVLENNLGVPVDDIYISMYNQNKEFIYGDSHLDFEYPDAFSGEDKVKIVRSNWNYISQLEVTRDYRWYVYEMPKEIEGHGIIWVRGISPASVIEKNIETIIKIFLIIFPFLLMISGIVGYFITKKAFRPIEQIRETAEKINVGNDLTERINMSDKYGKDEIYTLANTFDTMFDRLQSSFDREEQFTSDVSHELRTPISIISFQSEYGLKYLDVNDEAKETFENILDESRKMSNLVSQLLTLARMDKGSQKLYFESINLAEISEVACESQREKAKSRNITINNSIKEDIFIKGDEAMLIRVFINLIGNAVTYGKENGNIYITAFNEKDKIICKVSDDGIGIAKENIDRIWDRFYQVDYSRSGDNSGLGLALVKWIIKAHKGEIRVESELGKGTTFIFELPDKEN